jgi:haloacid dehalogenase-like hydrolase
VLGTASTRWHSHGDIWFGFKRAGTAPFRRRYSCRRQLREDEPLYFLALAADYDGTLAHDGVVDPDTVAAIRRLKTSGRRLILVTGRELPDLQRAFPELAGCDLIVAENGALLYEPGTGHETVLAPAPPEAFVARLRERGVHPLSVGRSIVASWEPMQDVVLETIREFGLELQIVFNKGAVMVLPSGVNKASGLCGLLPVRARAVVVVYLLAPAAIAPVRRLACAVGRCPFELAPVQIHDIAALGGVVGQHVPG